ncbi:hypothetical protein ABHB30_22375, partial [Flavonifractor plautii]
GVVGLGGPGARSGHSDDRLVLQLAHGFASSYKFTNLLPQFSCQFYIFLIDFPESTEPQGIIAVQEKEEREGPGENNHQALLSPPYTTLVLYPHVDQKTWASYADYRNLKMLYSLSRKKFTIVVKKITVLRS